MFLEYFGVGVNAITKSSYMVSYHNYKRNCTKFKSHRIKSLTTELASKGYNITSISTDVDSKNVPNLHYLHMNGVYDAIHNQTSANQENELIEMGKSTPWELIPLMQGYFLPVCKVFIESKGYKKLLDYPDNFKVSLIYFVSYIN